MALNQTGGYDLLLEVSESRIVSILREQFLSRSGSLDFAIDPPPQFDLPPNTKLLISCRPKDQDDIVLSIQPGSKISVTFNFAEIALLDPQDHNKIVGLPDVSLSAGFQIKLQNGELRIIIPDNGRPLITLSELAKAMVEFQARRSNANIEVQQVLATATDSFLAWYNEHAPSLKVPIGSEWNVAPYKFKLEQAEIKTFVGSVLIGLRISGSAIEHVEASRASIDAIKGSQLNRKNAALIVSNDMLLSIIALGVSAGAKGTELDGASFSRDAATGKRRLKAPISIDVPIVDAQLHTLDISINGSLLEIRAAAHLEHPLFHADPTVYIPIAFKRNSAGQLQVDIVESGIILQKNIVLDTAGIFALIAVGPLIGLAIAPFLPLIIGLAYKIVDMIHDLGDKLVVNAEQAVNSRIADGYKLIPEDVSKVIGSVAADEIVLSDDLFIRGQMLQYQPMYVTIEREVKETETRETGLETRPFSGAAMERYDYAAAVQYIAQPRNMGAGAVEEWFVNGQSLSGQGTFSIGAEAYRYEINDKGLVVYTKLGQPLKALIAVRVTNNAGQRRFTQTMEMLRGNGLREYKTAFQKLMISGIKSRLKYALPGFKIDHFPGPGPCPSPLQLVQRPTGNEMINAVSTGMKISAGLLKGIKINADIFVKKGVKE